MDRPILFSAPMVRALLEGRKTQTRRVFRPNRVQFSTHANGGDWYSEIDRYGNIAGGGPFIPANWISHCRYAVGDRLWVRESHHRTDDHDRNHLVGYDFASDPNFGETFTRKVEPAGRVTFFHHSLGGWGGRSSRNFPGIHMPRWASRLTLTVTGVRVQRLQEITQVDAHQEGCLGKGTYPNDFEVSPREQFRELWDSLNAARGFGWGANPWVCAITFEVAKLNIDAHLKPDEDLIPPENPIKQRKD